MGSRLSVRTLALLALLGGVVVLGFAAIFVTWAEAPGPVTALYRMLIGAGLITPFFLSTKGTSIRQLPRRGVIMAVVAGSVFGCDMAIWMTAVGISGPTMPTLMANTAPLWVGLGSLLIFRERQSLGFWIGLLLALSGVMLVFGHNARAGAGLGVGMAMGLVAALFYASFYLATQEGRRYLDTISYLWLSTLSAAASLLIINAILRQPITGYSTVTYLNFLALGAVVQFLGWLLINYAQGYLRASVVAPVLLGQPVLTALLAIPLLGEKLTPWHVTGGAAVLVGVYVVIWSRNRMLRAGLQGGPVTWYNKGEQ